MSRCMIKILNSCYSVIISMTIITYFIKVFLNNKNVSCKVRAIMSKKRIFLVKLI